MTYGDFTHTFKIDRVHSKKSLHSFTSLSCWDAHCEIVVIIVFLKQELLKFFKRFFLLEAYC